MILENMKDEIYKKKNTIARSETLMSPLKYNAYNRSATSYLVKHSTKQRI